MACTGLLHDPRLPSHKHRALMSQLLCDGDRCSMSLADLKAKAQAHPVPMALLVLECSEDGTQTEAGGLSSKAIPQSAGASQQAHRLGHHGTSLSSMPTFNDPDAHTQGLPGEAVCKWLNDSFLSNMGLLEDSTSKEAALAAVNYSIINNLTVQRHVVGYAKNMVLHKPQPVCFWSIFFPSSGAKQVDKICMWACELLDTDGTCTGHVGNVCRSILLSAELEVGRDVQLEVLIGQHMAYQYAPCMVTVLNMSGSIVSQNGESAVWLGCHTLEHNWPAEECESICQGQGSACGGKDLTSRLSAQLACLDPEAQQQQQELKQQQRHQHRHTAAHLQCSSICKNYFHALFYEQEHLLERMMQLLDKNETFLEDMQIRSPLLRKWLGATEETELWHRVHVIRLLDPLTQQMQYCLIQMDVTKRIMAEQQVLQLQQQQRALLTEILPPQVLEHLLMVKAKGPGGSRRFLSNHGSFSGDTRTLNGSNLSERASRMKGLSELDRVADSCAAKYDGTVMGAQDSDLSQPHTGTWKPAPSQAAHQQELPPSPFRVQQARPSQHHDLQPQKPTVQIKPGSPQQEESSLQPSPVRSPPSTPVQPAQTLERIASLDQSGCIQLTQKEVMDLAMYHEEVTILFADIKGFTSMVNQLHPSQVMLFLDTLYSTWDSLVDPYGVYKVETIGDCFMAASGLFCTNTATGAKCLGGYDPMHAQTMLNFAKAILESSRGIKTPLGETVQVRVGIHSGPCSSGVVGKRMPRWCLFGDTVNTANRMESNGAPGCIHASHATMELLPEEEWMPSGGIYAKGKGIMRTGFLPVLPGAHRAAELRIAHCAAPSKASSFNTVASLCAGLEEQGPPSRSATNLTVG